MANDRTPGPLGFVPAAARLHVSWHREPPRPEAYSSTRRAPPGPTRTKAASQLSQRPEAPQLSVFSSAELLGATEELELLTGAYELAMQSSNAKVDFARHRADPGTYKVEAYLRARDAWFGSSLEYQAYRELAARELTDGELRGRIDPNPKQRARFGRWREAQAIFYAWTRRGYERKLGSSINIPALIIGQDSPRLKAALSQVSLRSGHSFAQGTFNPRPEKTPIGYRLGTISEHAFGNAIDIDATHNQQLYAKEWAAIQSFTDAPKELADPAVRKAQWHSNPKELHTAISELSREFSARFQQALDVQKRVHPDVSQEAWFEALKRDTPKLAAITTDRLRALARGFFSLSWDVVGALHEAQFLWGATFRTPDLHHFELLPLGESQ
jgi:hypothetical protein